MSNVWMTKGRHGVVPIQDMLAKNGAEMQCCGCVAQKEHGEVDRLHQSPW